MPRKRAARKKVARENSAKKTKPLTASELRTASKTKRKSPTSSELRTVSEKKKKPPTSPELRTTSQQLQERSKTLQKRAYSAQKQAELAREKAEHLPHLRRLSSENPEARDEGPRLIPFSGPDYNRRELGIPSLPTDGYVSLADKAMKMWEKPAKKKKPRG